MSTMTACVVAYSGYQGEQEPRFLVSDGERIALEIRRRWLEPDARCFRVRGGDREYLLRCCLPELEWTVEPVPKSFAIKDIPGHPGLDAELSAGTA